MTEHGMNENSKIWRINAFCDRLTHSKTAFKIEVGIGTVATGILLKTDLSSNVDGVLGGLLAGSICFASLSGGTLLDDKLALRELQNLSLPQNIDIEDEDIPPPFGE